jgi:hypothetical protein
MIVLQALFASPGGDRRTDRGSDDYCHDRVAPQGSAHLEISTHQVQTESGQGPDGASDKPFHLAPLWIDRIMVRINVRVRLSRREPGTLLARDMKIRDLQELSCPVALRRSGHCED